MRPEANQLKFYQVTGYKYIQVGWTSLKSLKCYLTVYANNGLISNTPTKPPKCN